ncbi:MAG: LD-carboxypeptidase [Turicibacter sp.]|nr:LD-carboxypeptidase [Turicibacter sp.]
MKSIIEPIPLPPGGTIAIVAPAGPLRNEALLIEADTLLKSWGYNVIKTPSCFRKYKDYLAGDSDGHRAQDLMKVFSDDSVDAILCMRGGYGSNRLIPYFEHEKFDFSKYPKPFIGYSDLTYLHIYFNQRHGLMTFHGPMLKELVREEDVTNEHFLNVISGGHHFDLETVPFYDNRLPRVSGTLVGGNLSIVCSTLGTPYEIDTKEKVLFLEETDEDTYRVDRMIMQLLLAGKLHDAKGIILGEFNVRDKNGQQVAKSMIALLKKPLAFDVESGHGERILTLPMGAYVTMDPQAGTLGFESP